MPRQSLCSRTLAAMYETLNRDRAFAVNSVIKGFGDQLLEDPTLDLYLQSRHKVLTTTTAGNLWF